MAAAGFAPAYNETVSYNNWEYAVQNFQVKINY
jgi:hypothetical protein